MLNYYCNIHKALNMGTVTVSLSTAFIFLHIHNAWHGNQIYIHYSWHRNQISNVFKLLLYCLTDWRGCHNHYLLELILTLPETVGKSISSP